jgi:hypothetical protein
MRIILLLLSVACFTTSSNLHAHGPGHVHAPRTIERASVDETLGLQETAIPVGPSDADRWWAVAVTTGWESRHVHYGVDETGPSGAYVNEVNVRAGNFLFSAWNGFGLGNEFLEWDFSVAYNIEIGPVFIVPGYNLRYFPGHVEPAHDEDEEEEDDHGSHAHKEIGHELFLSLGTTAIPYVIPSANFIWDLNNTPGAFLEFRIDGDIPVYGDIFSLQPYTSLGLNFGYNTTEYYGWNNFQFGLQGTVRLTRYVSAFAGVNYSVALDAMQKIEQDNVFWLNIGLSFAY